MLVGLALAQAPLAQSVPMKPTTVAESMVSAGEVEDGLTGAWILSNDGTIRLCTARLTTNPEAPRCSAPATP
ncbi:hypothetical protein GCM10009099_35800 [Caenispirillum bisanense]